MSAAGFRVVVDAKRPGMPWGIYATRKEAEAAARKLRRIGMDAKVIAPERTAKVTP